MPRTFCRRILQGGTGGRLSRAALFLCSSLLGRVVLAKTPYQSEPIFEIGLPWTVAPNEQVEIVGERDEGFRLVKAELRSRGGTVLVAHLADELKSLLPATDELLIVRPYAFDFTGTGMLRALLMVITSEPDGHGSWSHTYLVGADRDGKVGAILPAFRLAIPRVKHVVVGQISPSERPFIALGMDQDSGGNPSTWDFYQWNGRTMSMVSECTPYSALTFPEFVDLDHDGVREVLFRCGSIDSSYPERIDMPYQWDRKEGKFVDGTSVASSYFQQVIDRSLVDLEGLRSDRKKCHAIARLVACFLVRGGRMGIEKFLRRVASILDPMITIDSGDQTHLSPAVLKIETFHALRHPEKKQVWLMRRAADRKPVEVFNRLVGESSELVDARERVVRGDRMMPEERNHLIKSYSEPETATLLEQFVRGRSLSRH